MTKQSIEGIRDPRSQVYDVLVRYRTKSGCNAKMVTLWADTPQNALIWAKAKVRRMRGVIAIDEAEVCKWAPESDPGSHEHPEYPGKR